MTPRTFWLILNAPLVHELLYMYNRMHHEMQALNPLLPIETKLSAHTATNCNLRKWVFATPTNELVAIIILGAPSCKLLFLWPNSRGHTEVWESVSPTQGATPKCGSLYPQLKGPHQSVGVCIPNSRGHTKVWESVSPTRGASNVEERTVNRLSSIAPEG